MVKSLIIRERTLTGEIVLIDKLSMDVLTNVKVIRIHTDGALPGPQSSKSLTHGVIQFSESLA